MAAVIISMYGGGLATLPAYLKDLFGGYNVSAIHGRVLTAWSTAGIVGPLIVNGILDHYVAAGKPRQAAYLTILHIMSGLLVVGLVADLLIRPVAERYWIKADAIPSPPRNPLAKSSTRAPSPPLRRSRPQFWSRSFGSR